jgi:hypothetical protein
LCRGSPSRVACARRVTLTVSMVTQLQRNISKYRFLGIQENPTAVSVDVQRAVML